MAKKKLYELTEEHRAQLKPWADKWIANAQNTTPMDDKDRDAMRVAVNGLYDAAKLGAPGADRVLRVAHRRRHCCIRRLGRLVVARQSNAA
jgi:hypothetical protein